MLFSTEDLKISKRQDDVNKAPYMDKEKSKRWYFGLPQEKSFSDTKVVVTKASGASGEARTLNPMPMVAEDSTQGPEQLEKNNMGPLDLNSKNHSSQGHSPNCQGRVPNYQSGPKGLKATNGGNDSKERIGFCLHSPFQRFFQCFFDGRQMQPHKFWN